MTIVSTDSTEILSQRQSGSHTEGSQSKNHLSLNTQVFLLSTLQVSLLVQDIFSAPYIMERNAKKERKKCVVNQAVLLRKLCRVDRHVIVYLNFRRKTAVVGSL